MRYRRRAADELNLPFRTIAVRGGRTLQRRHRRHSARARRASAASRICICGRMRGRGGSHMPSRCCARCRMAGRVADILARALAGVAETSPDEPWQCRSAVAVPADAVARPRLRRPPEENRHVASRSTSISAPGPARSRSAGQFRDPCGRDRAGRRHRRDAHCGHRRGRGSRTALRRSCGWRRRCGRRRQRQDRSTCCRPGSDGFVRIVLRGLARERISSGAGAAESRSA